MVREEAPRSIIYAAAVGALRLVYRCYRTNRHAKTINAV